MLATGAALGLGGLPARAAGGASESARQGTAVGLPALDPELAAAIKAPRACDYFPDESRVMMLHVKVKPGISRPSSVRPPA